jgi:alpha-1,3-rhamnosyl/mannosyltransferase
VRVAFNATPLIFPASGVAQYARGLAQALLKRSDVECCFFYGYGWSRELRRDALPGTQRLKSLLRKLLPSPDALVRRVQQAFFGAVERLECSVYHEPNFFPFESSLPTVTTIHDLAPIRFPDTYTEQSRRKWQTLLPAALRDSRLILTDSQFVRAELISDFGVGADKVRAIPLGVSPEYRVLPETALAEGLARYRLDRRGYALSVGTIEPRKNLLTTLEAYRSLPIGLAREFPLIIIGGRGWLTGRIEEAIRQLEGEGRVRSLGYVPQADMPVLYGGAKLLLYPSLYEGFGLPPLEAMACGTPVIASNRASLPEVIGGAGLQIDPLDAGALSAAIVSLLSQTDRWEALRAAGLARAREFSWDRCAELTLDAYRALA